jgi:hypothetical protein
VDEAPSEELVLVFRLWYVDEDRRVETGWAPCFIDALCVEVTSSEFDCLLFILARRRRTMIHVIINKINAGRTTPKTLAKIDDEFEERCDDSDEVGLADGTPV